MSTTGNEFEQPGVNYPDRGDGGGATATPDAEEPTRDGPVQDQEPAAPAAAEPSHEAVGIGVMDSGDGQDHHGQDEGRDTLTVGEAQRERAASDRSRSSASPRCRRTMPGPSTRCRASSRRRAQTSGPSR
nr:hypothetical protein GCM10025699_15300 [Microbacterium flavescens]